MEYFSLGVGGGPERTEYCVGNVQNHSSQILQANCISFGIMVTCFACIQHKLVSSNRPTR